MTQSSPADELRAAAETLRQHTSFSVPAAAFPDLAILDRAREPLAEWLDHAAHTAHWAHGLFADSETPDEFVQPHALAVARAITGSQP